MASSSVVSEKARFEEKIDQRFFTTEEAAEEAIRKANEPVIPETPSIARIWEALKSKGILSEDDLK